MNRKVNIIRRYVSHYLSSRSKFDLHSPFIYQFYSRVLKDKTDYHEYSVLRDQRMRLLRDPRYVSRIDLGAKGSDVPWQKTILSVRTICFKCSVSPAIGKLLYRMARFYKPPTILELGTSVGVSTSYLAMGYPAGKVITIEGSPEIAALAQRNFESLKLSNIDQRIGNFDQLLPGILEEIKEIGMVFIDGNHKLDATLNYFNLFIQHVNSNSILVFDDIHWSSGMVEAWKTIKQHPKVKVTIDLFHLGLVFFREELTKEDFIIRF
jgi:predicted O-methyltransferase YrrM